MGLKCKRETPGTLQKGSPTPYEDSAQVGLWKGPRVCILKFIQVSLHFFGKHRWNCKKTQKTWSCLHHNLGIKKRTPSLWYFLWSATNKCWDYTILLEKKSWNTTDSLPCSRELGKIQEIKTLTTGTMHIFFPPGEKSMRTGTFVKLNYFFSSPGEIQKLGKGRCPRKNPETRPWTFPLSSRELHAPLFIGTNMSANTVSQTLSTMLSQVLPPELLWS